METKRNKENLSARKYLKSNAKASFIRVGISSIATLVIIPFIIKNIGMEKYSYISITSFLISFGGIFDLGLSRALVYLVNEEGIQEKKRNQYISTIKIINLLIVIILLFAGVLAIACRLNVLGDTIPFTNNYYFSVFVCALFVLIFSIYNMYQTALLEGFFLLDYSAYGITINILVLNGLYFINLLTFNNLYFYISASVIANIVTTIYYKAVIRKYIAWHFARPSSQIVRVVAKQAYSFMKIGILTSINAALPRLVIVYLSPNISYVGVLDVITKITASIINLFSTISRPFMALSRINPQKIQKRFKSILALYLCFGITFWIGIYAFRHILVDYFFRNVSDVPYIEVLLLIYAAASLFFLMGQPFSLYLQGVGKNNYLIKIMTGCIFLFAVSYYIMNLFGIDLLLNLATANILISICYFFILLICSTKVPLPAFISHNK